MKTCQPPREKTGALIAGMGPQVDVFQKIAEAHGVTGARIEELARGQVRVRQEVEVADDVTGAKIGRTGAQ